MNLYKNIFLEASLHLYKGLLPGEAGALEAGEAGLDEDLDALITKWTVIPSLML